MADILTVADLEAAKKHDTFHSEVITGKVGGLTGGASINTATNAVTGQVQKTLPKLLDDLDWSFVGKFVDGVTFTKKSDFAIDSSGTQWVYVGASPFPVVVAPATVPSSPDYMVVHVGSHNATLDRNAVGAHDAIYRRTTTVAEIATGVFTAGDLLAVSDRAGEQFNVVAGGVADGYAILDAGPGKTAVLYVTESTNALALGCKADNGVTDNAPAINYGIALLGRLKIPHSLGNWYGTLSPLYMGASQSLVGTAYGQPEIRKTTNTLGTGSNLKPGGGGSDSYAKDAVLIITHADSAYATYTQIKNVQLRGEAANEYVVYAPRMFVSNISNVLLYSNGGKYGFVTHDTFMASFFDFQIAGNNANTAGSIGAWWDDEGDGSSGTSCLFNRMWVRDGFETAYKARGLVYSTFNACGSDKYTSRALDLDLCDITFNGFGFENRLAAGNTPLLIGFSRVNLNNAVGFSVAIANGQYVVDCNGATLNINGIRHTTVSATGATINVRNGGRVIATGEAYSGTLPTQTPTVDGTSSHVNTGTGIRLGNNYTVRGLGRHDCQSSAGVLTGYFADIFGTGVRVHSEGSLYFSTQAALRTFMDTNVFRPEAADNVMDLGSASKRWKTVFAGTGTINTSDARDKTEVFPLNSNEIAASIALSKEIGGYKWLLSIAEKGEDAARIHIGMTVQRAIEIIESHDLNPFDYGFICYDKWDYEPDMLDDDGAVIKGETPAGDRYGFRYSELIAFILAGIEHRIAAIESTLG